MEEEIKPAKPEAAGGLAEILATNQEILRTLRFFHNYLKWRIIWSGIKWTILIAIIVLGFVSLKSIFAYLQSYDSFFRSGANQSNASLLPPESNQGLINSR